MRDLRDDSPWKLAGTNDLLRELMTTTKLSSAQIAEELNTSFGLNLTRNAIISRARRIKAEREATMRGRRGGRTPKPGSVPRPKPKPRPPRPGGVPTFLKKVTPPQEIFPVGAVHWPEPVDGRNLTLLELDDTTCKWPLGEFMDRPPFLYCGNIVSKGCYCAKHNHLKKRPANW